MTSSTDTTADYYRILGVSPEAGHEEIRAAYRGISPDHIDAMETMSPPPRFRQLPSSQEAEVFACFWLLALAPAWRSTIYTFSDVLYAEVARAPQAAVMLPLALDVLVREAQTPPRWRPDRRRRPPEYVIRALGLRHADAVHVADAIGLNCDYLLSNDRQLRNKSSQLERRWHLRVRRPSEFLIEAVRSGAPWTIWAPWPWESIERIRRSS